MSYKAIYAYAWDLAETGIVTATDKFRSLGLDTVSIAGSYHAGKFLRPHGVDGKIYFPEDGTVYFNADPRRYGAIKPIASSLLKERDILRDLVNDGRINVNVWLVLLHNTPLGMAHPDSTVANAFGDRYVYSLCPAAPEARSYAVGLAHDVTEAYPVSGVSLETPGFLPFAHGYHHEFALNRPNRWLDSQLGLCFCRHCVTGAKAAGIDAERLKRQTATDIADYLSGDIDFPADMAEAFWLADIRADNELKVFLDWRCSIVTSLICEIRETVHKDVTVAIIPSVARPTAGCWYEGSDLAALAETAGIIEACFYEPGARRVKADLFDIRRRLQGKGKLRGILRPAYPDLESKAEFVAAVQALGEGGVTDVAFYNWGHVRSENLQWIAAGLEALQAFG
jgi:hypothetical protein